MQEVFVYLLLIIAIVFLVKKYFLPSQKDNNCNTNCGCK